MADADFAPPAALDTPRAVLSEDAPAADVAESQDPNYIPPLTTVTCETDDQRVDALKLVADSVAQQRQLASRAVLFHPVTLAVFIALGASIYQYFYTTRSDLAIIGTTFAGVVMTVFVSVRAAAGPYIDEAERVGTWVWLDTGRTKKAEEETGKAILGISDEIILTKFGDEPIGAIIFRGVQPVSTSASPKKGKKSATTSSQIRTEIRGWTVRQKYRHKGVGTALLEDAIKTAHEKGWASGGIEFASDHANSKKVLPALFNAAMEQRAQKAHSVLQKKVEEYEASAGKATRRKR